MKTIMLSIVTIMCLAGLGSPSFADEMGTLKGEMKNATGMMKDEMKAEDDEGTAYYE